MAGSGDLLGAVFAIILCANVLFFVFDLLIEKIEDKDKAPHD